MKERSSFREQVKFSWKILQSLMPNEHPVTVLVVMVLFVFLFPFLPFLEMLWNFFFASCTTTFKSTIKHGNKLLKSGCLQSVCTKMATKHVYKSLLFYA